MPMKKIQKNKTKKPPKNWDEKIQIKANAAIKSFNMLRDILIVYFPKFFPSLISQPIQKISLVFQIKDAGL